MDQPAPRTDEVPVPTAGQILVRALPADAVLAISLLLATWWLVDASSAGGPWWGGC